MVTRQHYDSSSDPASPNHTSHSSIKPMFSAEDDDNNQIDQKKSAGWHWCLKCCIIGSLLAGIGLAVVLTFYVTSKTTATETLISTTLTTISTTSATTSTSTSTSTSTTSTSTTSTSTSRSTSTSTSRSTSTSTSTTTAPPCSTACCTGGTGPTTCTTCIDTAHSNVNAVCRYANPISDVSHVSGKVANGDGDYGNFLNNPGPGYFIYDTNGRYSGNANANIPCTTDYTGSANNYFANNADYTYGC
ncbi:unnamed protein product [Adineta steineri]|uniref:Uncharacterized protein n=1 Tax=Adineta steineri TaxID=433720 RepID=A0A814WZC5_9BILA|nr:unnamed protein product [Adineta steineri]CAF1106425.1 unnamed protein product [Adineta steineri]CAF1209109.1 unnamed protein product [Adineta steineri]